MSTEIFVGLDVAVRPSGERISAPNDEAGLAQLVVRLGAVQLALIVAGATSGFERAAIAALAAAGRPVVVANPRQVRDFARATGQLAKTDQLETAICSRSRALGAIFRMRHESFPPAVGLRGFAPSRQGTHVASLLQED